MSSLAFSNQETLFSGGWDHAIRMWNLQEESNIATFNCENAVLDLKQSELSALLASGHSDNAVRLWDSRCGLATKLKLTSHTNWASCISWSTENPYNIASGGYDGAVKVWDTRSNSVPLYSVSGVESDGEKVFCIDWGCDYLYSGGQDGSVRIHKV